MVKSQWLPVQCWISVSYCLDHATWADLKRRNSRAPLIKRNQSRVWMPPRPTALCNPFWGGFRRKWETCFCRAVRGSGSGLSCRPWDFAIKCKQSRQTPAHTVCTHKAAASPRARPVYSPFNAVHVSRICTERQSVHSSYQDHAVTGTAVKAGLCARKYNKKSTDVVHRNWSEKECRTILSLIHLVCNCNNLL